MKLLRILTAVVILAYVGWLAWPLLSPLIDGATPAMGELRAGAGSLAGGDLFGVIPGWTLWVAAVALYLVAALMLGAGNARASVAYFLGFLADAVLRLALDRGGSTDMAARSSAPAGGLPVEPVWLVLAGLFLLGLVVAFLARRRKRPRIAGQLSF